MHVRILLQITADDGTAGAAEEVAAFEKQTERPEDLGLSIAEGKALLAAVQTPHRQGAGGGLVAAASLLRRLRRTPHAVKGSYPIVFRTLYGDVNLRSPRLHRCPCQTSGRSGDDLRRCATSSPATSRRSGFIWKRAGRRSCPMPLRPGCWPTCCRLRPARTPPRCASTPFAWRSAQRPNSTRSEFLSSMAAPAHPDRNIDRGHFRRWEHQAGEHQFLPIADAPRADREHAGPDHDHFA